MEDIRIGTPKLIVYDEKTIQTYIGSYYSNNYLLYNNVLNTCIFHKMNMEELYLISFFGTILIIIIGFWYLDTQEKSERIKKHESTIKALKKIIKELK